MDTVQKFNEAIKTIENLPISKGLKNNINSILLNEKGKFKIQINENKPYCDAKTMGRAKIFFGRVKKRYVLEYMENPLITVSYGDIEIDKYFDNPVKLTDNIKEVNYYKEKGAIYDSVFDRDEFIKKRPHDSEYFKKKYPKRYRYFLLKKDFWGKSKQIKRLSEIINSIYLKQNEIYENKIKENILKLPDPPYWMINAYLETRLKSSIITNEMQIMISLEYLNFIHKELNKNDKTTTIQ